MCSETFAQRRNTAKAVAAASVRAPGGRLHKEAFVQAATCKRSRRVTNLDVFETQVSMKSSDDESVPTLRVKLSDLLEAQTPALRPARSWSRPTVASASCAHSTSCGTAKADDQPPASGAALEEWASRQFLSSLRAYEAPCPVNLSRRCSAMSGSTATSDEADLCDACGCCIECGGSEIAQRTGITRRSVSRQSWQDSLRSPAGWHYLDFSCEGPVPIRSSRRRWRRKTLES